MNLKGLINSRPTESRDLESRDYEDRCRELGLDTQRSAGHGTSVQNAEWKRTKWDLHNGIWNSENETGDRDEKPCAKICQDWSKKVLFLS